MRFAILTRVTDAAGTAGAIVLYVDDDRPNLNLFRRTFADEFELELASSAPDALDLLARAEIGVVVSDQKMPGMTGIELLMKVKTRWPQVTRILLTAYSDRDLLLEAIQRGQVHDYVLKPWEERDLRLRLRNGLDSFERRRQLERAVEDRDRLHDDLAEERCGGKVIGLDGGLQSIANVLDRVAHADSPILLRGEIGTGKEVIAREIHRRSLRAQGHFVRIACGGGTEEELVRDLFGVEATASHLSSTDARGRIGRLEQAHGGTLYLDEIADLPKAIQSRLLKALSEGIVRRIGDGPRRRIDVRTIGATAHDIEDLARAGRVTSDTLLHIGVIRLEVPSLRERPVDIEPLARAFVDRLNLELGKRLALSDAAIEVLRRYDWPGNVRELGNVIERAAVLADREDLIGVDELKFDLWAPTPVEDSLFAAIAEEEAERIRQALRQAGGSKLGAARLLGIPRTTLNDRIRKHRIR